MATFRGLRRWATAAFLAVVAAVALPTAGIPDPVQPAAAAENRVALIVDTGTEVRRICIRFSEPSLTGRQVLERAAGIDPVFHDFGGGRGSAVCALCGKGCPPDSTCLTCQEPNYWAYHRAASSASKFTYSNVGPGSTEVRDGDVEGWRWGTGAAPPFATVATVCDGAASSSPTTASTAPTSGGGGGPGPADDGGRDGGSGGAGDDGNAAADPAPRGTDRPGTTAAPADVGASTTVAPAVDGSAPTSTAPFLPGVSAPPADGGVADAAAPVPAGSGSRETGSSRSGTASGLVAFVAALAAVAALVVRARRARR